MFTSFRCVTTVGALAVMLVGGCAPPDGGREERLAAGYLTLLAAEDARPASGPQLARLIDATDNSVVLLRQTAVRALGRLEDPGLMDEITPLLDDPVAAVRAEAANALAQAVHRSDGDVVLDALVRRAEVETDSLALAAIARSLGRAASSPSGRARASEVMIEISRYDGEATPFPTKAGVAQGFESMVRRTQGQGLPGDAALRLAELAVHPGGARTVEADRLRGLAIWTLAQARRVDHEMLDRAHTDGAELVRLIAARSVGSVAPGQRPELFRRLLGEGGYLVPLETVLQVGRQPRTDLYCRFLLAAGEPGVPAGIRAVAMDALAQPCPQLGQQRRVLSDAAASVADMPDGEWHVSAHALVALARLFPNDARGLLAPFTTHANPFARAYAATVAALLEDSSALRTLASDEVANIRTAALDGLFSIEGHDVDALLIAQLSDDDPQLLMTSTRLLEGSPLGASATDALIDAFDRISAAERETWRDSRRALLERIGELGDASFADSTLR